MGFHSTPFYSILISFARDARIFFCSNANMPDHFAAAAQSKSRAPRGFYRAILTERRICGIVKHRIGAISPRLPLRNLTGKNQFKLSDIEIVKDYEMVGPVPLCRPGGTRHVHRAPGPGQRWCRGKRDVNSDLRRGFAKCATEFAGVTEYPGLLLRPIQFIYVC